MIDEIAWDLTCKFVGCERCGNDVIVPDNFLPTYERIIKIIRDNIDIGGSLDDIIFCAAYDIAVVITGYSDPYEHPDFTVARDEIEVILRVSLE